MTLLQARVEPELHNDFILAAKARDQSTSELLRELVNNFLYTKEGHLQQQKYHEMMAEQHKEAAKLLEEREAKEKRNIEEMKKLEEEMRLNKEKLELERMEKVRIDEEAHKIWQKKETIQDISPEIRSKVEEKLAEWKAKFNNGTNNRKVG